MISKKAERRIRTGILVVAVVMAGLNALNQLLMHSQFDSSIPEISFDQEYLEVPIETKTKDLLLGVTANDQADGDVSDTLIVESISKMLNNGDRIITYAAFDKDKHVGIAERRMHYTNYTSPKFSLDGPLVAESSKDSMEDMLNLLHATDCIDGDISGQIMIMGMEPGNVGGSYTVDKYTVQVINSCGDISELTLPIKVPMETVVQKTPGEIVLSEYMVYCNGTQAPDWQSYIVSATMRGETYDSEDVTIESNVDYSTPGVYTVTYMIEDDEDLVSVDLLAVVE